MCVCVCDKATIRIMSSLLLINLKRQVNKDDCHVSQCKTLRISDLMK